MPSSGWWNQGGLQQVWLKKTQTKPKPLFFWRVDVSKHHSCLDLLLDMSFLKSAGTWLLELTAGKCSLRSSLRFGCQAPGCSEAGAGTLSCTSLWGDCSSPSVFFLGLVWFGFAKHCCFRFLYISGACVQKGQPQVKPGSFVFFQTWYADKTYPVEIKRI